jgi:hypothetical protein
MAWLPNYGGGPTLPERVDVPALDHPDAVRFQEILKELGALHDQKQADYGRDKDPHANVRAAEEFGVKPWVAAMVRANDKMRRLQKFSKTGTLVNEGAKDSLRDIAVYAVIALVFLEEEERLAG